MRKIALVLITFVLVFFFSYGPSAASESHPEIPIIGEINSDTPSVVQEAIDAAKKAGAAHLVIRIDSPGGSVGYGMLVIKAILDSNLPTTCIVDDMAVSMAGVILESPACGWRVVHAQSVVMFHGVSGSTEGNERVHQNAVAAGRAINLWTAQVVCARTGWEVPWYMQRVAEEGRELWFVGQEALDNHVADSVIPVRKPVQAPAVEQEPQP